MPPSLTINYNKGSQEAGLENAAFDKRNLVHFIPILFILALFFVKYFNKMIIMNRLWQYGAWYEFLENPSVVGKAGLIDPALMENYKKTLAVSMGHQLIVRTNQLFGFEEGLTIVYIVIAILFVVALYLLAFHLSQSKIIAFLATFFLINTDLLAMGHAGACGHLGQTAGRDYLAIGFVLLAVFFLLKKAYYTYWLFLMLGFMAHMPHGLMAFVILLPFTWTSTNSMRFRIFHLLSFVSVVLGIYLYLSIGSPTPDPALSSLWFKWSYIFAGGHIFWDHSIHYLAPTYAFFSILIAGFSLAMVSREKRFLLLSIFAFALLAATSTFFLYVVPLSVVYELTPIRSTFLVSVLLLVFILTYLIRTAEKEKRVGRVAIAAISVFALITDTFTGMFIGTGGACLLSAMDSSNGNKTISFILLVPIALLFFLYLPTANGYDAWFLKENSIPILVLAVGSLAFMISRWPSMFSENSKAIASYGIAIVCLICITILPSRYVTKQSDEVLARLAEYSTMSRLIEKRTQPGETVLTAPFADMPMLEVTAKRGSIFQLPKASVAFSIPELMPGMNEALKALGIDIQSYKGNWLDLLNDAPQIWRKTATAENLIALSERYHARCVFTYADHRLGLPVLVQGKYFVLYDLTSGKTGKTSSRDEAINYRGVKKHDSTGSLSS